MVSTMTAVEYDEKRFYSCSSCGATKTVLLSDGYAVSVVINLPHVTCGWKESDHKWALTKPGGM